MNKKEIGSEFWDIPLREKENSLFPDSTKWFLSGRTALSYILQDIEVKSVAMPRWCCQSMVDPFLKAGIRTQFYEREVPIDCDALLLIDYFGFTDQFFVPENYKGTVLRDITHSLLSKKYDDADYYFGSLRKWAGFKTGGFAFGKWKKEISIGHLNTDYIALRADAMKKKEDYIRGRSDSKNYLEIFSKANRLLDDCEIAPGLSEEEYAARHLDIDFIKTRRRENAKILIDQTGCIFEMKEEDCPLFVPILTEKRDELRRYLINHQVYCPVHWPRFDLENKELSLVCDQRYDTDDMNYVCELIKNFSELRGIL